MLLSAFDSLLHPTSRLRGRIERAEEQFHREGSAQEPAERIIQRFRDLSQDHQAALDEQERACKQYDGARASFASSCESAAPEPGSEGDSLPQSIAMHIPDDLDPKSVVLIDALRFALSTEQRRMSAQAEEVVELRTETQSLRSALDRATRQLIEESRNARHRISEITILRHALEEERGKAARAEEANAALETEARDARALRKQVAAYEQSIRESNRMFHKLQQEVALHRKLGTNSEVSYPPHEAQLWMSELNDELQGALSAEELASVHDLLAREKQACKLASEAHSRAIADLEALRHSTATEVEALHQQFEASRRELEMQLESEQRSLAQTHAEAQHALDTLRRKESVEIELSAALEEVTHVAEQQKAELVMLQKLASTAQAQIARLERENGELRSAIDGMRSQRDSAITAACR